jgi:hypothetical protein
VVLGRHVFEGGEDAERAWQEWLTALPLDGGA